ncbi:MAG: type I secretion system permease/ATPase [Sphingomonas sp.]|uniref:type I secretion system permease/ATPase n=1 Tax=Sphingomonas sp. TaxID=28214 RepID=UPI0025FC4D03|nr:type I secretion system permease/ATPase [Sphingomonas sp.]MBX9881864.1 type I secretion system permease/ATPase [Sphingomonas sp.]
MTLLPPGTGVLGQTLRGHFGTFVTVAGLTALLNILLLGGSVYMMLVYDSALPSASVPSLLFLFAGVTMVYVLQALIETTRAGLLTDLGSAVDEELTPHVQHAMARRLLGGGAIEGDGLTPMRDLDQIRGFLASAGPAAFFDLPWILFFLGVLSLLHPWLGVATLLGAAVMVGLTYATHLSSRAPSRELAGVTAARFASAERVVHHVETLAALGMLGRAQQRFVTVHARYLTAQEQLAALVGRYGGASRTFRMFLQSGVLTVGALLVLSGQASAGVIFASSILSARALGPIDVAIANWRGFAGAQTSWRRLNALLAAHPEPVRHGLALPYPRRDLSVTALAVAAPGSDRLLLQGIDLRLKAGDVLGVIGPSAAGKSSLARALLGLWAPARGSVRYDGATPDQWDWDRLGAVIGYLPQSVELFDGTIAENIARFDPNAQGAAIVDAARLAGVHELIVALPQGYDTPVGHNGVGLSAGQRQRIGLARALYGEPFLIVLDEPNSNLDMAGEQALAAAISASRARGAIVVVITHRSAILSQTTHVLLLRDGRSAAFGPREQVLARLEEAAKGAGPLKQAPAAAALA